MGRPPKKKPPPACASSCPLPCASSSSLAPTSSGSPTKKKKPRSPDVEEFWNNDTAEWARDLWSPANGMLRALHPADWPQSSRRLALDTWFKVTMQVGKALPKPLVSPAITIAVLRSKAGAVKTKKRSRVAEEKSASQCAHTDLEEVLEAGVRKLPCKAKVYAHPLRARRYRLNLSPEQKFLIDYWLGATRYCYNVLVDAHPNVGSGGVTLKDCRKLVEDELQNNSWLSKVPYAIRDSAVRDFVKARNAHFAKLAKLRKTNPDAKMRAEFKFRCKRDLQCSFEVEKRDMSRKSGMFALLALDKLEAYEKLPEKVETAVRFVRDRLGNYYLVAPIQVPIEPSRGASSVVALDPGVRTFQTSYDARGLSTEWGNRGMNAIEALCHKADHVQAALTRGSRRRGSRRRGIRRVLFRLLERIRNKVREIHRKLARWLCLTYTVILIPKFETSQMVLRGQRNLRSRTVRQMLTWGHYTFRQLLKTKAEVLGAKVIECDEAFTSKTCGGCGVLNESLGGSKHFKCAACEYSADRDINGARNILLRYLTRSCKLDT